MAEPIKSVRFLRLPDMTTQSPALLAAYEAALRYIDDHNLDVRCPIEPVVDAAVNAFLAARHQDNLSTHAENCWSWGYRHYECAVGKIERIQAAVNEQADDEGLWFVAATAAEGYLQQELRRLHAVIEDG